MWDDDDDDDDERKGEGETRCRIIACASRKAPRGPPGLTSPSDGRIAINSIICLLNIHTDNLIDLIERMKYNNFTIGTHDLLSNSEPVNCCECVHSSTMYYLIHLMSCAS